jgi:hypothetical protein
MVEDRENEAFELHVIVPHAEAPGEAGTVTMPGGGGKTELHGVVATVRSVFGRAEAVTEKRVLGTWDATMVAIGRMLEDTAQTERQGLRMTEMEVSLGLSGEGTVGFATVGAEAAIKLKFTRG